MILNAGLHRLRKPGNQVQKATEIKAQNDGTYGELTTTANPSVDLTLSLAVTLTLTLTNWHWCTDTNPNSDPHTSPSKGLKRRKSQLNYNARSTSPEPNPNHEPRTRSITAFPIPMNSERSGKFAGSTENKSWTCLRLSFPGSSKNILIQESGCVCGSEWA